MSFLEDNQNHRYVITSAGNGRPELILSFALEPGPTVAGDLDLDGTLTVRDIDALAAAIRRGDSGPCTTSAKTAKCHLTTTATGSRS